MNKLSKYLVVTFCIGATLALLSTLEPWIDETFGEKEKIEKTDKELCGKYPPHRITGELYCRCSDKESQLPGHCKEKYK